MKNPIRRSDELYKDPGEICDSDLVMQYNRNFCNWAKSMQERDIVGVFSRMGISRTTIYSWINKPDYPANSWHVYLLSQIFQTPVDKMYGFRADNYTATQRWRLADMIAGVPDEGRAFLTAYIDREIAFVLENDQKSIVHHRNQYTRTKKRDESFKQREMHPVPGLARRIKLNRTENKFSIAYLACYAGVSEASLTLPRMDTHSTGLRKLLPFAILMNVSLDYLLGTGYAWSNIEDSVRRGLYSKLMELDLNYCALVASVTIHETEKASRFQKFLTGEGETNSESL